ncbi:MAG TPA: c-type cytochrome biogenesis protein CcmI [Gammaproteobacteria bacterium]|nr:c-type cytochrome biogenesis protein CcmI [Gammaproteobacteria bacterium]
MTLFVFIAAVMILAALAIISPALLGRMGLRHTQTDDQNIRIARENLAELKIERDQGRLDEKEYQQARKELESILIQDISSDGSNETGVHHSGQGRLTLVALFVLVPVFVSGGYFLYGSPDAIEFQGTPAHTRIQPGQQHSLDELIARLAKRMEVDPDNIDGWLMLGRSYMSIQKYQYASNAYEQAYRLDSDNPEIMLFYADALAMTQGGKMSGQPLELINKALAMQPDNAKALWLTGMSEAEQGNFQKAIDHWQKLVSLLKDEPESRAEVEGLIALARQKMGSPVTSPVTTATAPASAPTAVAKASIKVRVELEPDLAGQFKPTDTLFIYARALQGPPMPLAAVRMQASDLPVDVTLDESMAMMPSMSLSKFPQVRISARISPSGNAIRQPGDLIGEMKPVTVGQTDIVLIKINSKIE